MAARWAWLSGALTLLLLAGCQRHAETGGGGGPHGATGVATPSVGRTPAPYTGSPRGTPAPGHPAPTVPPNPKAEIPGRYQKPATPLAPAPESRPE